MMERALLGVCLLLFAGYVNNVQAMYDGTPTTINKVPYLAIVYEWGLYSCFGTIISESWMVTTGDCVNGTRAPHYMIRVGAKDNYTGKTYKVNKIVKHPNYGKTPFEFDYALIQIKGNFTWTKKVKPAKLPTAALKAGKTLTVSSFGAPDLYGDLREGWMSLITNDKCKSIYQSNVTWSFSKTMGCLYNPGRTTLCDGEWAAPAIFKNTLYYLFIMYDPTRTANTECEANALPSLMADIYPAVSWITKITGVKP